jgi:hypothetical protein
MADSNWLLTYFGGIWHKKLHPAVIMDGKYHAVVRVSLPGETHYILVRKSGVHTVTPHYVLAEGVLSDEKMKTMRERLQKADGT